MKYANCRMSYLTYMQIVEWDTSMHMQIVEWAT